jgi:hypothetical protein
VDRRCKIEGRRYGPLRCGKIEGLIQWTAALGKIERLVAGYPAAPGYKKAICCGVRRTGKLQKSWGQLLETCDGKITNVRRGQKVDERERRTAGENGVEEGENPSHGEGGSVWRGPS